MTSDGSHRISLYTGEAHECPYLPGRTSRSHFVDPWMRLDPADYAALLAQGFRRSGDYVYRPACPGCSDCVATRLPVDGFAPNRSQRRCARLNADLVMTVRPGELNDEQFALYSRYVNERHPDGGMADPEPEPSSRFLFADWCETKLLELRLEGRLVAAAVTDIAPGALSAVYTFFDPALHRRSLGSYAIMAQVDYARRLGLRYLYLGYWIKGSRKMEYKTRFQPLEHFDGNRRWRRPGID